MQLKLWSTILQNNTDFLSFGYRETQQKFAQIPTLSIEYGSNFSPSDPNSINLYGFCV